jgi:hypothetical protein
MPTQPFSLIHHSASKTLWPPCPSGAVSLSGQGLRVPHCPQWRQKGGVSRGFRWTAHSTPIIFSNVHFQADLVPFRFLSGQRLSAGSRSLHLRTGRNAGCRITSALLVLQRTWKIFETVSLSFGWNKNCFDFMKQCMCVCVGGNGTWGLAPARQSLYLWATSPP